MVGARRELVTGGHARSAAPAPDTRLADAASPAPVTCVADPAGLHGC